MRIIAGILSFIILIWTPAGKVYMVWFKFMRGLTFRQIIKDPAFRKELMDAGIFGFLTPWLNNKWYAKAPEHKKIVIQGAPTIPFQVGETRKLAKA